MAGSLTALPLRYDTFLGLTPDDQPAGGARVAVVSVPYDRTTSYGTGAARGPEAIIGASQQVELYDPELGREPWAVGIETLPALEPSAEGPHRMVEQVQALCADLHRDGRFPLLLGGEHSVAEGAGRAAAAAHGELTFLQIDAHLDLRDTYEGSPHSHACVARRLLDLGKVVAVGVRTACPEEMAVIARHGLRPVWAHEAHREDDAVWRARVMEQLGEQVYITLDVDGLDPSVIAATGTPVPGGLCWYQVLDLLREVGRTRRVVGCDVCELAPAPGLHASAFAAALLAYKMIGYFVTPEEAR